MAKNKKRISERGIALLTALLFLILLSAMAVGLMYMSSTETQVNANFRAEQSAYFAARAGMEELRDRMASYNPHPITTQLNNMQTAGAPSTGNLSNSFVYLINNAGTSGAVQPWNSSNKYKDTELCHDSYGINLTATAVDVPCTAVPSGTPTTVDSQLPYAGTSAAIPFKWARLSLKLGNTVPNYPVDKGNTTSTAQVCWNGTYQVLLATGKTNCTQMNPRANPVYLITALAVTKSGGRKMVQGEVALQPNSSYNFGLFATGTGCGAITMVGNSYTDSYNSANGAYTPNGTSNRFNTGGDVGSNGNVSMTGTSTIGGSVSSPITPSAVGACPDYPLSTSGGAGLYNNSNDVIKAITAVTIPSPTIPATTGPNKNNPSTLSPGNYGDITLTSHTNLTLATGVYNINSIRESGQATITITGPVTLNVQGNGGGTVVDLTGGGYMNNTGVASNFIINYAGSGTINIKGGTNAAVQIYAPSATVNLAGNSDYYGSIIGAQINLAGGAAFHYDTSAQSPIPLPSYYTLLSFRELFY